MILDNLDKSFLRLVTDFSVAKSEILKTSQYNYKENIIINPNKATLQISNSLTNIAFDDSYIVELVDCADDVVLDITDKVFINEFQDINGIYQIAFEILPILQEFYFKRLFLKFKHTGSDLVLWSNPINVTDCIHKIRIEYKNYEYYQGISYDRANYYQSIEINGYMNATPPKETTKIYTKLNGNIRSSRPIQALEYVFNIDALDSFTLGRLMVALNSEIVYINGVRFTKSENISVDDRLGMSNQFPASFKGQFTYEDTLNLDFQIFTAFDITTLFPLGFYSIENALPIEAEANFTTELLSVTNVKIYKDEVFLTDAIPVISGNSFTFELPTLVLGDYYVTFDAVDIFGRTINVADNTVWYFSVVNAEYEGTEYDNTEYITN